MALADDIKTQIDAWVAADDEAALCEFHSIVKEWTRAAGEKAVGIEHADIDACMDSCKADLDTLLTP